MEYVKRLMKDAETAVLDDELIERILKSNDCRVFLKAIGRVDCPPGLLVDLSQSLDAEVRMAVARHPNAPDATVLRLQRDTERRVATTARSRASQ